MERERERNRNGKSLMAVVCVRARGKSVEGVEHLCRHCMVAVKHG